MKVFTPYTHILKNWGYYRLLPESVVGVNLDRSDVLGKHKASASPIGLIAGDERNDLSWVMPVLFLYSQSRLRS